MWPVLVVQFSFEFLINDVAWEGEVQLITSLLHLFCEILGVLGFVGKIQSIAFRTMFYLANAVSIGCEIQFRVFDL